MRRIPLYSAGGELQERITEAQLATLAAAGVLLRVVRHRKGYVNRAILRPRLGDGAILGQSSLVGTKYSFREHLDTGHLVWRLMNSGALALHQGIGS